MKAALVLAVTLGAVGCEDNDLSLSIVQMEAITQMSMCVVTVGTGALSIDRGLLDVSRAEAINTGYMGAPVLRNNLAAQMVTGGVEYNAIQTQGINVQLLTVSGAPAPLPAAQQKYFVAGAAGRLDPGAQAPMPLEILPVGAATALAAMAPSGGTLSTVIVEMRPVGMRTSNQVIGGPIDFPVDLCNGCLGAVPACPFPKGTTLQTGGCFGQQDNPGQCCSTGVSFACGTTAPVAM